MGEKEGWSDRKGEGKEEIGVRKKRIEKSAQENCPHLSGFNQFTFFLHFILVREMINKITKPASNISYFIVNFIE